MNLQTVATIFERVAKRKKSKRSKEEREMYKHYGFGCPGTDKNYDDDEIPTAAPPEEEGDLGMDEEGDDYEAFWED